MKKRVLCGLGALLCAVLLCIAANLLAFTIDTQEMRDHTWQGCLMLGEQLGIPQTVGGFLSSQLDNFTSVLILKTAGYVGPESLLDKAFAGFRVDMPPSGGQTDWEAFCNYEFGELSPTGGGMSYSRYWHGYTLPLRLMLCVLDAANLQMMLYFIQMALFILVLYLMHRRSIARLIPAFFLSYFLLMPFASSICLQYVPVTMLMLIASALILQLDQQISRLMTLPAFFALVGLLTNYFDLLTFPLVSLLFPLAFSLVLRLRRGEGFTALFMHTALCGVCWALGYGGMWALKWVLNGMVFGWHMLLGVVEQIGLRASDNGGSISRFAVLLENLEVILAKKSYLLIIACSGLATLAPAVHSMIRKRRMRIDLRALNLLLPVLAVCLWYVVMANHSYDHTYFTYRSWAAGIFACFACVCCLFREEDAP